jgi:hypothetical protein
MRYRIPMIVLNVQVEAIDEATGKGHGREDRQMLMPEIAVPDALWEMLKQTGKFQDVFASGVPPEGKAKTGPKKAES